MNARDFVERKGSRVILRGLEAVHLDGRGPRAMMASAGDVLEWVRQEDMPDGSSVVTIVCKNEASAQVIERLMLLDLLEQLTQKILRDMNEELRAANARNIRKRLRTTEGPDGG